MGKRTDTKTYIISTKKGCQNWQPLYIMNDIIF